MKAPLSDRLIKQAMANPDCSTLYDDKMPVELRIQSSRQKGTWWLVSYSKGRKQRTRLGYYPTLKPADIGRMLPDTLRQLQAGQRPEVNQLETMGQLLQWYRARTAANTLKKHATRNLVTCTIDAQLLPRFAELPVNQLDKDKIDQLLVMPLIGDGLKASTIKKYWGVLKAAVADAARLDKIARHYMAGFQFTDHLQKAIKPKECSIKPGQLPAVLAQISAGKPVAAMMALFMLLHATRIGETRQMRWDHVDFVSRLVVLPAEITKTTMTHVLPLSELATELLQAFKRSHGTGQYVFGNMSDDNARRLIGELSGGKWSSHDLRKLARTTWADLGIDYWVAERLLNHKPRNLDAVYIKTDSIEQRRNALTQYHQHLQLHGLNTGTLQALNQNTDNGKAAPVAAA